MVENRPSVKCRIIKPWSENQKNSPNFDWFLGEKTHLSKSGLFVWYLGHGSIQNLNILFVIWMGSYS
jgi:hypothetical protein